MQRWLPPAARRGVGLERLEVQQRVRLEVPPARLLLRLVEAEEQVRRVLLVPIDLRGHKHSLVAGHGKQMTICWPTADALSMKTKLR